MLVGQQIGPFAVEKELGSGAMGTVYRAKYSKTGQRVAIEIIAPGLAASDKAMERFEREGAILKQLRHPNIVRLYATGKFQGTPFYAMEYIQGESLDRVMSRRGRMSWEEVVGLGQQLCAALQHAHDQGIIHRDLKPSNLMVLPDGTVKLTDFGIAKDLDNVQLTSANCTVGTASYMSPEQCKGERDLTAKSDLYSLGILLYELITGTKPYQAEAPMDLFLLHVQGTFERPSRRVLDMPVWLDTLICQLLEKKPEQRPLNAETVSQALGRVREKVEAQQSAGMDVVRSRPGEINKGVARLNQEDKEAARGLLGKRGKKRKKASGVPFTSRIWFKAAIYSGLLIGVLVLIWTLFLRRESPDKLFDRAQALMSSKDLNDWSEARDGPIKEYLDYYGSREGGQARLMRHWADLADLVTLEGRLKIWINQDSPVDSEPEGLARDALKWEDQKKPDKAREKWTRLAEYRNRSNEERTWGLLGQQHVKELELKPLVRARTLPDKEPARGSAWALSYETFGDAWKARDLWRKVRDEGEKEKEPVWFLLASRHLLDLKNPEEGDEKNGRITLLQDKLKAAAELAPKKPAEAMLIYQDITDLYSPKDEEVAPLVKMAEENLRKLPPAPNPKGKP